MKSRGLIEKVLSRVVLSEPVVGNILKLINSRYRETNVVMFHVGRCGSTVLGNMLRVHTDIAWATEIFEKMPQIYRRIIGRLRIDAIITNSMYRQRTKIYGFEMKYLPHQHLRRDRVNMTIADYVSLLRTLGISKFIILGRKNYLRRAISIEVLRQTGNPHTSKPVTDPTRVKINIDAFQSGEDTLSLLECFSEIDQSLKLLKELLAKDVVLELGYEEDILENPEKAYLKVCDFLGVESQSSSIRLNRTNPFPIAEMVTNIEEIKALLNNTQYAWMLDQ